MKKKTHNRRRPQSSGLEASLCNIEPLNDKQELVLNSDNNIVMHGCAGTGKTFLASYIGYEQLFKYKNYDRITYVRSTVQTRNMGFMPGDEKEKIAYYEAPYQDIAGKLFSNYSAYEIFKQRGLVSFMSTAFTRGINLDNALIIVDECQNMTFQELDTINTRVGEGSRIIYCGDIRQKDLNDSGIKEFFNILKNMGSFDFIDFTTDDIVRSKFVKEYLITKYRLEDNGKIKSNNQS